MIDLLNKGDLPILQEDGMILEDAIMLNVNNSTIQDMKWYYDLQKKIEKSVLYINPKLNILGLERFPHISVLYKLFDTTPEEVSKFIKTNLHKPYIEAKILGISKFYANETRFYDVLKIDIDSYELAQLHYKLKARFRNNYKFPTYQAHITLAYVEAGSCTEMIGPHPYFGKTIKFSSFEYVRGDYFGKTIDINL